MMPIVHIQEFQALFNLSIVLYQMASLGYLSDAGEIKDEDMDLIAERAMHEGNPLYPVPKIMNKEECKEVLKIPKG